ncbi:hypothetical protein I5535_06710 [Rhodobacteraceae bacterium F11138]|nr:hypothetical protein [Rhodobacteraceae bacterium F11138]
MKTLACQIALILGVAAGPLAAQQTEDLPGLMERGMEMFMDGLREEMSPALENMRELAQEYGPALSSFLQEMGPAFGDMLDTVKDWTAYHPPEILPNGDIIMRKKTVQDPDPDAEAETPPETSPGSDRPAGQIDL